MDSIDCSKALRELPSVMDNTCENKKPILITRKGGDSCVILSHTLFCTLMDSIHKRELGPKVNQIETI